MPQSNAFLVQLLLPLYDNDGKEIEAKHFRQVTAELTERFGGLTAYTRAPAQGLWKEDGVPQPARDDLVVYEVMCETLDRDSWREYRHQLEERFRQETIVIRAQAIESL